MTEQQLFDKVFTVIYESSILGRSVIDTTHEIVDLARDEGMPLDG
jgi:hypothetical protein